MTDVEFNPEAIDGDNDGIIQEGTPFERPVEEAEVNPVVEDVIVADEPVEAPALEEAVITAPEPVEETPAIVPVADGVIGTGKVKKAAKPAPKSTKAQDEKTVALFAVRNLSWQGVGKLVAGYNLVSEAAASKWLTLDAVREATPEEIKARLG